MNNMHDQIYEIKLEDYASCAPGAIKRYYGTMKDIGGLIDRLRENETCANSYATTIRAFDACMDGEIGATHIVAGEKIRLLTPVRLIKKASILLCDPYWTYEMDEQSKTHMRAQLMDAEEILIEDGGLFRRCIRPCFQHVQFLQPDKGWCDFGSVCTCFPFMAQSFPSADAFNFRLFVHEQSSESIEDCLFSFGYPDHVNFKDVCGEMFGMYDPQDL